MRTLNRISLAAAVALALAGMSAIAATTTTTTAGLSKAGSPVATPPTTPGNSDTNNVGNRTNTGSATSSAMPLTPTTTTVSSGTPGMTGSDPASAGGSFSPSSGSASVSGSTNVDPATTRPDPFGPGGAFANPGSTAGTGTGSTSGTGTASTGTNVGQVDANGNPIVTPTLLPGSNGAIVLDANGQVVGGVPQPQQNVLVQQPAPVQARAATPLFDEVAREGLAKEQRRKAQGNEPRIYGIAPRTDRDLTYQMPDDPIIRY